jgi:hypothetical protein
VSSASSEVGYPYGPAAGKTLSGGGPFFWFFSVTCKPWPPRPPVPQTMLSPALIRRIKQLLAERTHTYRQIARLLGVSCGTISAIASGKRWSDEALDLRGQGEPEGPPLRCPRCGGLVMMPCVLCSTRKLSARTRRLPRDAPVDRPLGLDLKPEHQRRYAEVRMARRKQQRRNCLLAVCPADYVTSPHSAPEP